MSMYDVVIIGAGPAGLAAAIACRKHNLKVVVLDEFPHAGGRLLGQLHEEPTGEWWNGIKEADRLKQQAEQLETEILLHKSVHHIAKNKAETYTIHTKERLFPTKNVLIATGAAETAAPIPGWTLPGVMSIGAAQVMTNVHRVRVGKRGVIVGVNVLSAAIARELQIAGIDIRSIALPISNITTIEESHPKKVMGRLVRIAHLAPSAFIRFGSKFAQASFIRNLAVKFFPKSGIYMWGMPIHLRKAIKQINGQEQVESVTMVDIRPDGTEVTGTERTIPVDFVCIAGGLYPLAELASVAGVPFRYVQSLGGHVPVHNERMQTPVEHIYVAGNITGIESAKVAREQGTVAGLSIAYDITEDSAIHSQLSDAIERVSSTREEATIQFDPHIIEGRNEVYKDFDNHNK